MDYVVAVVNKYKERLDHKNDVKKILRALQKLNEVDMTIDILQLNMSTFDLQSEGHQIDSPSPILDFKTEVGKAVNKLKKLDGIGSYAKEIVLKWKKLLQVPQYNHTVSEIKYETEKNCVNEEYDPTQNWEMQSKKEKISKQDNEYDPTQNWQMKKIKPKKSNNIYEDVADHNGAIEDYSCHKKDRNPIGSDDDYLSSREDDVSADAYSSSVTSQTLSSFNRSPDTSFFHNQYEVKTEKNSTKPKKSPSKFIENTKTENRPNKRNKDPPKKSKTVPSNDPHNQLSPSKKLNSDKNNKRKAEKESSIPSKKSKHEEVKKKETKKSKHKTVKSTNSNDLSFEQFMMMDTTSQLKKKKKIKAAHNKLSLPKPSSYQSKVEIELPKVQTSYRPLPSIASSPGSLKKTPSSAELTDELAAALHTQRNSKKMQVYSGQKLNCLPKMLSLYDQCMNVLLNNIDNLDVIGVPYDIVKPVLERCTVEQLYRLEDSNPYLLNDTSELWQKHSQQDFRNKIPEELESWREMYLRLYDAREEKLARLTHSIQAKVNKAKPLEKRTKLAYVGVGSAKAPRHVLRAQMKYGTAGKKPIPYERNSNSLSGGSSSALSLKKQVSEIRLSVPAGVITASTVDEAAAGQSRFNGNKKQPPRIAPMMAKTLKSINKLRYRR